MYEYIQGKITELTPAYAILENKGIGYFVHISLHTYAKLAKNEEFTVFLHQTIREDAHIFYGFFDKAERELFRLLISVSGIGPNTARMMLSSLTPEEIQQAIASGDVNTLKNIKGIGAKSAQRVIVDLKDKIIKEAEIHEIFTSRDNTIREESLSALVMLGFQKKAVEKVIDVILSKENDIPVEELVKRALKKL